MVAQSSFRLSKLSCVLRAFFHDFGQAQYGEKMKSKHLYYSKVNVSCPRAIKNLSVSQGRLLVASYAITKYSRLTSNSDWSNRVHHHFIKARIKRLYKYGTHLTFAQKNKQETEYSVSSVSSVNHQLCV